VHADAISRTLYANERLLAGEFWCARDSTRWHSLNSVSPEPRVIFPPTPVTIRELGRDPVVCDRNQIVFYNPGAESDRPDEGGRQGFAACRHRSRPAAERLREGDRTGLPPAFQVATSSP